MGHILGQCVLGVTQTKVRLDHNFSPSFELFAQNFPQRDNCAPKPHTITNMSFRGGSRGRGGGASFARGGGGFGARGGQSK